MNEICTDGVMPASRVVVVWVVVPRVRAWTVGAALKDVGHPTDPDRTSHIVPAWIVQAVR